MEDKLKVIEKLLSLYLEGESRKDSDIQFIINWIKEQMHNPIVRKNILPRSFLK